MKAVNTSSTRVCFTTYKKQRQVRVRRLPYILLHMRTRALYRKVWNIYASLVIFRRTHFWFSLNEP